MPSPRRLMPAGKTLERDQVVNQTPSIWGFITLHQSIVYPWTQLSDFSQIRQRPASNPEILTLCDLEGRIPYSPGMTLSARKGEHMDTSGKTTEKGFYRRRWGLGTAGASESHTWSASIHVLLKLGLSFYKDSFATKEVMPGTQSMWQRVSELNGLALSWS